MGRIQPLPIRNEQPPPDDWLVLRGGSNSPIALRTTIERSTEVFGRPLISVVIVHPANLEQALSSRVLVGYKVVTFCRVGDIGSARLPMIPTFGAPHYSIELPDGSETSMNRFIDIASGRMENLFYEQ